MNTVSSKTRIRTRLALMSAVFAVVFLGTTSAVWAQPQVTITCGQPTQNGNVDIQLFVYADAQGTHGVPCNVSVPILATDTPAQKATKIANGINNAVPPCGCTAAAVGAVVTVTDPTAKGVICTKFADGTNEPSELNTGTGATVSGTGVKWQLYGDTTTGTATIGVDGVEHAVDTTGMTIPEIYEAWRDLFGYGFAGPDGFLLPVDAIWPHDFSMECTDPALVIAFEQPETGSIPTVSEWGLIILTLLLLTAGTIVIARQRRVAAV